MQLSQDVNPHTTAARQTQVRHSISIIAMKATAGPLKEKQGCPLLAHITHTLCKAGTSGQQQNSQELPPTPSSPSTSCTALSAATRGQQGL